MSVESRVVQRMGGWKADFSDLYVVNQRWRLGSRA